MVIPFETEKTVLMATVSAYAKKHKLSGHKAIVVSLVPPREHMCTPTTYV